MSRKQDFSYINTVEDLHAMQNMVKVRIKEREKDLVERMHKVPQEAVKATIGAVVPAFLNNRVAGTTWTILKGSIGLLFKKKDAASDLKDNIFASAKKLGLFTALKAGYRLWSKK